MKLGRTLSELAAELERQQTSKRDFIADTRKLHATPQPEGGILLEGVNGGMRLRATAHQQLASTLGIPKPYYDRMLLEAPDLLARNVNRWLLSEQDKADRWGPTGALDYSPSKAQRKLIRTLDGEVRAILSDSYRPLDNLDLAEAVLPKLMQLSAIVVSGEVTENRFYLKAVTDRIAGEVKTGDIVQAGIVVSNSEVGQGSLRVEALDYRLVCLNGMIREQAIRKAHLGRGARGQDAIEDAREYFRTETRRLDDAAFFAKVQDAAGAMFDDKRFQARLAYYQTAAERPIEKDPVEVVEVTSKKLGLNEGERKSVLQHLIKGGDLSQWGLANAVTRAAADMDSYDRATELEALGGDVIELTQADWRALAV